MDRIVRDRGSVGRRIWRRRKRRAGTPRQDGDATDGTDAPAAKEGAAHVPAPGPPVDVDVDLDDLGAPAPPVVKPAGTRRRGLFGALRDALASKPKAPKPPAPEPAYLVVDPTRDVLAVPRGAARLDAFERAIKSAPPGTPQFRALALAFAKELLTLAENAGVDLSLFEARVEACAQALLAAGEEERAGTLFLRVGKKHRAAELFVAAGAIDALEEVYAQIQWDEGGAKLDARMSFERFEALFLVGMRDQAFDALDRAHRLWHDNPIYADILRSFAERIGAPRRLVLQNGAQDVVVTAAWPLVIGRGEDATVRLASPLISRAHLKIELIAGEPVVVDLESKGGTRIGGVPLEDKRALPQGADIDMGGVVVRTRRDADALWLEPALAPGRRTLAMLAPTVTVPGPAVTVRFDGRGRAVLLPPATLNDEKLARPTIALYGDRVGAWTVSRGT